MMIRNVKFWPCESTDVMDSTVLLVKRGNVSMGKKLK